MLLYTIQALAQPLGWTIVGLHPFTEPSNRKPAELILQMGLDVASMGLVAFLSAFLARQASRVRERLRKAEALFNDLNKLNEAVIWSLKF